MQRILKELNRLGQEPPSAEEIRAAEARSSIFQFATISGSANALSGWALTPTEPIDHYLERLFVNKVPPIADLQRAANTYLTADAMHVVLVGDAARLTPALAKAGLGPADVVSY